MTEPVATDEQQERVRKRASVRWWSWFVGTLVVCVAVLALLGQVFPVAMAVVAGFGASAAGGSKRGLEPSRSGRAVWVGMALQAAFFIGLALLLGAAGLGVEDHPDTAGAGALLGGALVVAVALVVLFLVVRGRRRAVDAEVERYRNEQSREEQSRAAAADDPS